MNSKTCPVMSKLLTAVSGYELRSNDILFSPARNQSGVKGSVVFFPGDVQDLHDIQIKHRDNSRHIGWCLERTAEKLASSFPRRNIVVVRPARKELATFSCFDNFVQSDNMGNPTYSPSHNALQHTSALLESVAKLTDTTPPGPLTVLGFSKGIVVLNQMVHELANFKDTGQRLPDNLSFDRFVWLDGGHNGGPGGIYVTDMKVVQSFSSYNIPVDLRLTPYQDQDSRRPWIHKECKTFARLLTRLEAGVTRTVYFEHETPSIETHFNVINTLQDQTWDQE